MLSINTNLSSLIAQSSMKKATFSLNQAVERMTTGFKINSAKDNAANYSITQNMTTKINSYMVAQDNVAMGLDMLTTAEENLNLISDKLTRLRDLATQASNGTYGESSLNAINAEANALVDEIERLYSTTEYNGQKLFEVDEMDNMPKAGSDGFIETVEKVDTTNLDKLSGVSDSVALSSGTYSISTHQELAQLATMTNNGLIGADCVFVLANDIDLSSYDNWTPIGTNTNKFAATFDGNGYKISNLKIDRPTEDYLGLFGDARAGNLKNVGVINVDITGLKYIGGLSGCGGNTYNCHTTGIINGFGNSFGGLLGQLYNGSENLVVKNCYSEIYVNVESNVPSSQTGGLIGAIAPNSHIKNCYVLGNIKTNQAKAGGIVGGSQANIENCYFIGDIEGESFVGGIAGTMSAGSMNNCYAEANIKVSDKAAGGLTGNIQNGQISITNSYSKGTVESPWYAGGITGVVSEAIATIENCYSDMKVLGTRYQIGGLIGRVETNSSLTLNRSYFTGTIDVRNAIRAGGIVGEVGLTSNLTLNDVYFAGSFTGSADRCGGLVGSIYSIGNTLTINNSKVLGSCSGINGLILGQHEDGSTTAITDSGYSSFYSNLSLPVAGGSTNGCTITNVTQCTDNTPFSFSKDKNINLQIGINSNDTSQISLVTSFDLLMTNSLRGIGNSNGDFLSNISNMLNELSSKQTEFGAVQNRLESALDSIEVNINNITSSRSTLRDADIAEESSTYIRQQILQQASATLLATANQAPSIALQLI